jgi:hypothetical protein
LKGLPADLDLADDVVDRRLVEAACGTGGRRPRDRVTDLLLLACAQPACGRGSGHPRLLDRVNKYV